VIVTGDRQASFVPALVPGVDHITPPALNFLITHGAGPCSRRSRHGASRRSNST
jgi:hypothetical protein